MIAHRTLVATLQRLATVFSDTESSWFPPTL